MDEEFICATFPLSRPPPPSRGSGTFEGPYLSGEVLAEHNDRILKVERSKLSSLVSQSKANLFVEKSARIATLMEAMAPKRQHGAVFELRFFSRMDAPPRSE